MFSKNWFGFREQSRKECLKCYGNFAVNESQQIAFDLKLEQKPINLFHALECHRSQQFQGRAIF